MGGLNSTITDSNNTQKWHDRLANVSIKAPKYLNDKGMLGKDHISNMPFRDHRVLGKHHKMSFSSSAYKTFKVLEYIYTNLWGPESNPTFGGNKYFLFIIDDFSKCISTFV